MRGTLARRSDQPDQEEGSLLDIALAVLLSVVALIEVSGLEGVGPVLMILGVLQTAPLALRRRFPFGVFMVVGLAISAYAALGQEISVGPVATFVALYGVAARGTRLQAFAALAIQALGVAFFFLSDDRFPLGDVTEAAVLSGLAWGTGEYVRTRRLYVAEVEARAEAQDQTRREQARQAVAEERTRMARELHDVVGHGVTLMVVQAGAGRGVVHHDPSRAEAVFRTIEETGRSALGELDRLLGILRPEGEQAPRAPAPGLDQLPALVGRFVEAGLAVEVEVAGEATPLPPAVESAIYRVTQEALTNTLRHAGTATATVRLGFLAGGVELEVTDDGAGASSRSAQGGRGLVGIRERMDLLGGEVDAGPRPGGGFLVHCRIPLPAS
ncbi:MAG: sensor histidine kinase [Actinomycetota bacterium]|nr:sensor histidine kinase [Actinomycetota bacterium]